jgi:hypothetical protein
MKLKPAILAAVSRDDLKEIVDHFDLDGVDRRSVEAMRSVLGQSRKITPDDLLGLLRKDSLQVVCQLVGLPTGGNRNALVQRLLAAAELPNPRNNGMHEVLHATNGSPAVPAAKKPEKLTLPRLEQKLFKACDILRGNMDAYRGRQVERRIGGPDVVLGDRRHRR